MAAKKIGEGNVAIRIIRNAGPISNFCNDVVGDISGIISGGIGITLTFRIMQNYNVKDTTIISICMTAIIASLTVGGKALGKFIVLLHYEKITYGLAKFIKVIERTFKIKLFTDKKNKSNKKTSRNQKVKK